jgi:hypothetical protein
MNSCERCGATDDVKYLGIGRDFLWICYACYMKDDAGGYTFGAVPPDVETPPGRGTRGRRSTVTPKGGSRVWHS